MLKNTFAIATLFVVLISTVNAQNKSPESSAVRPKPLNILFFLADDCNWDSVGAFGCPIPDITPNMDRLATQGMRFMHTYSTVSVCTPVRATMMTGLLPHHNGCEGFEPISSNVITANERMHEAGYYISMFGKNGGYEPRAKYCLDLEWQSERGNRNPAKVYEYVKEAVAKAQSAGMPFFCHMNCADPHRPFYGSSGEQAEMAQHPDIFGTPSRIINPSEVPIPRFLDDLPDVRKELTQYFNCVRRLDDSVGQALKALEESGEAGNTLIFLYAGDHGMSFPFSKSNAYVQSNHGGLIVRWPGVIKPNSTVTDQVISTVDFTPTWLESAKLPTIPNLDGRSFATLFTGAKQANRGGTYCYYYRTAGENLYNMRSIHTLTDTYIWNPWSDGETKYSSEGMAGLSWKAMLQAAKSDPVMKARCEYNFYRVPEEYFWDTNDSGERQNRIDDPACQVRIKTLQDALQKHLTETGDPLAAYFPKRKDAAAMKLLREQLEAENRAASQAKKTKQANKKNKPRPIAPDETQP